jgi:hypothetical protein
MSFIVFVTLLDVGGLILILLAIKFAGSGLFEGAITAMGFWSRQDLPLLFDVVLSFKLEVVLCACGLSCVLIHRCVVSGACLVFSWEADSQGGPLSFLFHSVFVHLSRFPPRFRCKWWGLQS